MNRIIAAVSVLFLAGCSTASPGYVAKRQAEVLAKAEATCSHVTTATKNIECLNWAVHQDHYWGQGVRVVASKGGAPRLVDYYSSSDGQYNVGGDLYNSGANPGSAR